MKKIKQWWNNLPSKTKKEIKQGLKALVISLSALIATIFGLSSCQVTRTITTESSSIQRGDTSVIIQTKTIESYNAVKK